VHILIGVVLGSVLIVRLAWRAAKGGMRPPLDQGVLLVMARAAHILLYGLLVTTVGLGVCNAWVRGDSVFGLFSIPGFAPGDKALRDAVGGWHALAANSLLVLAGFHAAAALFHHYGLRDLTLRRMLPRAFR